MTKEQRAADAAEDRRERSREVATEKVARLQARREYCAVTLHMQAGLIVRIEVKTSEAIGGA